MDEVSKYILSTLSRLLSDNQSSSFHPNLGIYILRLKDSKQQTTADTFNEGFEHSVGLWVVNEYSRFDLQIPNGRL